jgi:UDP-N-acetylmuramate-alanine ligase
VEWDHADVYPTEESYFNAFQSLVNSVPKNGMLILAEEILNIKILNINNIQYSIFKTYGKSPNTDYQYTDIVQTKEGFNFNIRYQSLIFNLRSSLAGDYMPKNITGCFAMAHQIGIAPEGIIKAIANFKNIKRRLEKKLDGKITVFDDIAHSPAKAKAVLASIKKLYNGKVIAVFEPNTGNRKAESATGYANAFKDANEVIIPRLTQVKISPDDPSPPFDGQKLAQIISETHNNVKYIGDDTQLIQYLITNTNEGDVVIFLGSHGFRGMIERVITVSSRPSLATSGGIPI